MQNHSPKFAILGTGNSGQAFAADISLKGYSVNLAEVSEFENNLLAIEKKGGIEISGDASKGFAKLNMITTDLKKAIHGVDIIIIGGSAYAHEPFSKALMHEFEDGQFIVFTSNFGAMRFYKWMQEEEVTNRITPVETMSLLYATRAVEPGVVTCFGVKSHLPVAALPANRTQIFLDKIRPVFPQLIAAENVWVTSVNNFNPIVDPPIVLFNAGRIESTGGKGWNLYADGATESVTKIMLAMDAERMSLMTKMGVKGIAFRDNFEELYTEYAIDQRSLSEAIRKSPIHSDPSLSAPATVDTRYLTEDLPFGLAPWSEIGRMWGLPTPNINAVIQIASTMLDTNFIEEGLTVRDLAIEGMDSSEVREYLQ